jgi:enamine deaminase RidA (YjgF/YER057c/UK114 family)
VTAPGTPPSGTPPTAVVVPGWAPPRGYANGMIGAGRTLYVAGQIGWDEHGQFQSDDLIEQFDRALANVIAVVEAAGASVECIASLTIYVTDIDSYRTRTKELGPIWRARMGRHYPAMALVAVSALVELRAKVEIQAHAIVA